MDLDYRIVWSDGSIHHMLSRGQVSTGRVLGVVWDITERRQLEQEKYHALQVLEQEQRQRAQQAELHRQFQREFTDRICHEIRNPLNGVYGSIDMLKDSVAKTSELISSGRDILCGKKVNGAAASQEQLVEDMKGVLDQLETQVASFQ